MTDASSLASVTDLLTRFGEDFNNRRDDRMGGYYAIDFAAVVDGAFVDRQAYLDAIAQLFAAGYRGIRFEVNHCRRISDRAVLADGTTRIEDASGNEHQSRFSINCAWSGSDMQFLHTHSSTVPHGSPQ